MNDKQMELSRWLDTLATTVKTLKEFDTLETDWGTYELCGHCQHGENNKPYLQLYRGLRDIAETLGLNYSVKEDYDEDSRLLQFEWKGVDFIELEDK